MEMGKEERSDAPRLVTSDKDKKSAVRIYYSKEKSERRKKKRRK
jgi:hypothetical protein